MSRGNHSVAMGRLRGRPVDDQRQQQVTQHAAAGRASIDRC